MAIIARVNGRSCDAGTLYASNAKVMLITVKDENGDPVDLTDGSEDQEIGGAVEEILKEINPLVFLVEDDDQGKIFIAVDVSLSAQGIQDRIRNLGEEVGPNDIDVSGTTVEEGDGFAVTVTPPEE